MRDLFWKGAIMKRRGTTLQDYDLVDRQDMKKTSLFVKFGIIIPNLCFLLDPLTNKHRRTWSSMINLGFYDKLVDSFQDLSKVNNPSVNKAKV